MYLVSGLIYFFCVLVSLWQKTGEVMWGSVISVFKLGGGL